MTRLSIVLCLVALSARAHAQAGEGAVEEARRLFREANTAIDAGRLAEARELLQRSMSLAPHPSPAFNLAVVYQALGEHLAAAELLARLVDGRLGEVPPRRRDEAIAVLNEVRRHLGVMVVAVSAAAEVRIDGERVTALEADGETRVDLEPGRHTLRARSNDGRVAERTVRIEEGSVSRIDLVFASALPSRRDAPSDDADEDGGGVASSPWLWLGIGAVVVAGAIAIAFFALADEPNGDEIWGAARPLVAF